MPSPQGRYWIGTIPDSLDWSPPSELPDTVNWIRGQKEQGAGGLLHWQVFVALSRSYRRPHLLRLLPGHWELSRSRAAEEYVWKESTRVPDSQFELGSRPFNRSSKTDWDEVRELAKSGNLDQVPADIYIKHYTALRKIGADHDKPLQQIRYFNLILGLLSFSGAKLELVNPKGLGKRQEWTLTLKIPSLSGGTATMEKVMLLSMNSEEWSRSRIFYDGQIVTRSVWKQKGDLDPFARYDSGSPLTLTQDFGTQI